MSLRLRRSHRVKVKVESHNFRTELGPSHSLRVRVSQSLVGFGLQSSLWVRVTVRVGDGIRIGTRSLQDRLRLGLSLGLGLGLGLGGGVISYDFTLHCL